jgi:drug/metabolite transporter (DMT)-like permease
MSEASPAARATRRAALPVAARFAFPLLLLGGVAIGLSPIFVRLAETGPIATAFWRVLLALPALALWARLERGPRPHQLRGDWKLLGLAGLFFSGDLSFWHLSIALTSVANATLFANFNPVFVTFGAFLLFGERVRPLFLLALAVAMTGAAVLMSESFEIGRAHVLGDVFGIVTGLFWACYFLSVSRLRARVPTGALMFWTSCATAAALLPIALLSGDAMLPSSPSGWATLLALALVSHAAGQGLIALALAHLPAALSSLTLLIEPLLAAIFAWILLGEPISLRQLTGGAVILAGIALARRSG